MRTGLPQRSARRPDQRSVPLPRSGHYTLPFSFVPATAYGCFSQFCSTITQKKQETGRGLNTIEDFFAIAKKAAEIAHREGGWDKNPVDMGWCTVGVRAPAPPPLANRCVRQRIHMRGVRTAQGSKSTVRGAAPCFVDALDADGRPSTAAAPSLERMGFKPTSLTPDPDHCALPSRRTLAPLRIADVLPLTSCRRPARNHQKHLP